MVISKDRFRAIQSQVISNTITEATHYTWRAPGASLAVITMYNYIALAMEKQLFEQGLMGQLDIEADKFVTLYTQVLAGVIRCDAVMNEMFDTLFAAGMSICISVMLELYMEVKQ